MTRSEVFNEYDHLVEIVPGVFLDNGSEEVTAVYIVDDAGEVVCWNTDEFADDATGFTAALTAVAIAAKYGASMVRTNIETSGQVVIDLCNETHRIVNNVPTPTMPFALPKPDCQQGYSRTLVDQILSDNDLDSVNFWLWMRGQTVGRKDGEPDGETVVFPYDLSKYLSGSRTVHD